MTIYDHLSEFAGFPVVDYQLGQPFPHLDRTVPRLRVDYDSEHSATDMLMELLRDPAADRLPGLIIGAWSGEMYDTPPTEVVEALVAAAGQLPNLRALFLGEITSEENEISWIHQTDVSAIWEAFPKLTDFAVRGANGLSLGQVRHDHLRRLIVESGGLPANVLREVAEARLPELEHLELYLGTSEYGWDGTAESVAPLLSGELFPKLRYLGLRDSEIADEVAALVARSPMLSRIETLDLSLGTLGDTGAEALLAAPALTKLKKLDLHHHYLSNGMMARLQALPIEVDVSEQESEGDYDRYVAVGE